MTNTSKSTKRLTDRLEGKEALDCFDSLVRKVLSVPHSEIARREVEYKKQSRDNLRRRGPKRKGLPNQNEGASR